MKDIRKLKKEAKAFTLKNYFRIILPIIFMISNSVTYLIWNYFMLDGSIFGNDFLILLCLISIVIIQFIICPFSIVWFYKTYLVIYENKNALKALAFFKEKNTFTNLIKINFLPSLLNILILIFSNGNIIYYTKNTVLLLICCALKIIINYKLFISNYYFLVSKKSAKETIKISFSLMQKKVKLCIRFYTSFIGWYFIIAILYFVLKGISLGNMFSFGMLFNFKFHNPILKSLSAYSFGLGFLMYPYLFITKLKYCKEILGDTVFK